MESADKVLVDALLRHDPNVTREFFYRKCYPLFKSVYDNYHTDCASCLEFINEIYLHIMTPDRESGLCRLQNFQFRSTLFTWIKTVSLFYCYKKYELISKRPTERIAENFGDEGVRIDSCQGSISKDEFFLPGYDVETLLRLMPNRRYSLLIRYVYLEGCPFEEAAQKLGMNMNTFYNKHKLAKDQFTKTLKNEESYHG